MNPIAITIAPLRAGAARALAASAVAAVALAGLAGCASAAPAATETPAAASSAAAGVETGIAGLTVVDPWAKATDKPMTGLFGTLRNDTGADLEIASITVAIAGSVEQHETVVGQDGSSVMQPVQGGFTIPAGGELALAPGEDHIMLMGLTAPILPGDEIPVTIEFADGQTASFTAIAKEYTAAQESYAPGHGDMHGSGEPSATPGETGSGGHGDEHGMHGSGEPTATP